MKKITFDTTLPKNLALLFKERVAELGDTIFQYSKDKDGKFIGYSYKQVYQETICFALALQSIGIKRAENVALISDNRREWGITDYALLSLGAISVPRGCDSMGTEIRFIIDFADCKVGIFETYHQFEKVLENVSECPKLKTAIIFQRPQQEQEQIKSTKINVMYFDELLKKGKTIYNSDKVLYKKQIEAEMELTESDDLATIIFTSGTTGTPKGVMLSHKSYLLQCQVAKNFFPCKKGDIWLSILPVWHSFERIIQYYILTLKCSIAYSKPIAQILISDMKKMKPGYICGVPRLWDGIARNINKQIQKKGKLFTNFFNFQIIIGKTFKNQKDKVFGWTCQIKKRSRFLDFITGIIPFILLYVPYKLADLIVFKKIKKNLGGNIRIAISGGGSLQKEVNDFYRAIDFNLLEGYGLTETAPLISVRHYKVPRPECVGVVVPSMEIKIVQEENGKPKNMQELEPGKKGLILIRSQQLMKGYYKRDDLTQQVVDKDGWFNTGDIGLLTFDKELKITGRAKDTIVLLGGENIEPALLEQKLLSSDYIESAIIFGQDKNYLGCLIVPSKDAVLNYASQNGIENSNYNELLESEKIQSLFSKEVHTLVSVANGFRSSERINTFKLIPESFTVGQELSAKQEMIRPKIAQKYKEQIEALF